MIHRLFTTCSRVVTSKAIVCVSKTDQSQFGATALVVLVELQVLMEAKELLRTVATQAL